MLELQSWLNVMGHCALLPTCGLCVKLPVPIPNSVDANPSNVDPLYEHCLGWGGGGGNNK